MKTKELQKVRKVISACSEALCDKALHMSITYDSKDVVECVDKMSDDEWTAWTNQPGNIRSIYYMLMTQPSNYTVRALLNAKFELNIERDTKAVANILVEA
jgi:hypothetical protein